MVRIWFSAVQRSRGAKKNYVSCQRDRNAVKIETGLLQKGHLMYYCYINNTRLGKKKKPHLKKIFCRVTNLHSVTSFTTEAYSSFYGKWRTVHPLSWGHAVARLVEALRYKPEGRGFGSRWCNFSLIYSFRPLYGPGIDSASNSNEYQACFLEGNGCRCLQLTTLLVNVPIVLKSGSLSLLETSVPVQGLFTSYLWLWS